MLAKEMVILNVGSEKPDICRKYSVFWAEIIRMTLESIVEVTNVEATESSAYFEWSPGGMTARLF